MGELIKVWGIGRVSLKVDMSLILRLVPEIQRTVAKLVGKDIDHIGMLLRHHVRGS